MTSTEAGISLLQNGYRQQRLKTHVISSLGRYHQGETMNANTTWMCKSVCTGPFSSSVTQATCEAFCGPTQMPLPDTPKEVNVSEASTAEKCKIFKHWLEDLRQGMDDPWAYQWSHEDGGDCADDLMAKPLTPCKIKFKGEFWADGMCAKKKVPGGSAVGGKCFALLNKAHKYTRWYPECVAAKKKTTKMKLSKLAKRAKERKEKRAQRQR